MRNAFNRNNLTRETSPNRTKIVLVVGVDQSTRKHAKNTSGDVTKSRETESFVFRCCCALVASSHLRVRVEGRPVEEIVRNQFKPSPDYGDRVSVFVPFITLMVGCARVPND